MLARLRETLLDLIYPPKCPVCRCGVSEHGAWCRPCLQAVWGWREISAAQHHLRFLDRCIALYRYEAGLKRLMHDMKFRKASQYGRHMGWLLEQDKTDRFSGIYAVAPVPLHRARLAERGFNQTELIFRGWAKNRGFSWADILVRIRETQPQWELTVSERQANMKNAFRVGKPELVAGRNILLVDDIFTTGLTLDACAGELKKAGARRVYALVLASNAD